MFKKSLPSEWGSLAQTVLTTLIYTIQTRRDVSETIRNATNL